MAAGKYLRTFYLITFVLLEALAEQKSLEVQKFNESQAKQAVATKLMAPQKNLTIADQRTQQAAAVSVLQNKTDNTADLNVSDELEFVLETNKNNANIMLEQTKPRSSYVNNEFVPDENLPQIDNSPPLYELLQKQMEQVLATTGQDYALFPTNINNKKSSNNDKNKAAINKDWRLRISTAKPLFGDYVDNADYTDDTLEAQQDDNNNAGGYAPFSMGSLFTQSKPSTNELPSPILNRRTTRVPYRTTAATTSSTTTTAPTRTSTSSTTSSSTTIAQPTTTTTYASKPAHSASSSSLPASSLLGNAFVQPLAAYFSQQRPVQSLAGHYLSRPLATTSTSLTPPPAAAPPSTLSDSSAASQLAYHTPTSSLTPATSTNSTLHLHRRRIAFKTVSSSSQFVSTPLADLMFKFSIGIARPSKPLNRPISDNSIVHVNDIRPFSGINSPPSANDINYSNA